MYSDIYLTDPRNTKCSLSNSFKDVRKLEDSIEDCKDSNELLKVVQKLESYGGKWKLDKDSDKETRLVKVDKHGNVSYVVAVKDTESDDGYVYSGKCKLTNSTNVSFSLSNQFKNAQKVKDALETAKDAKELINSLNSLSNYKNKWEIEKDTNKKSVLKTKDNLGNLYYFEAIKEAFDKIVIPDISNTPMTPSGFGTRGMQTRWIYSEYGRFLSVYGIHSGINVTFNLASTDDIQQKLDKLCKMRDNGLVDNIDLQELEERLRLMSNISIYGNGSEDQTSAALQEEVKSTTTSSQLEHIRNIQPLSHTEEANKKRKKTLEARREEKLLGL